jgi:hypothetical protein
MAHHMNQKQGQMHDQSRSSGSDLPLNQNRSGGTERSGSQKAGNSGLDQPRNPSYGMDERRNERFDRDHGVQKSGGIQSTIQGQQQRLDREQGGFQGEHKGVTNQGSSIQQGSPTQGSSGYQRSSQQVSSQGTLNQGATRQESGNQACSNQSYPGYEGSSKGTIDKT